MQTNSARRAALVNLKALSTLGPAWATSRARIALLQKFGILRQRTPLRQWTDIPLSGILQEGVPAEPESYAQWRRSHSPSFLFPASIPTAARDIIGKGSVDGAERILQGDFPFFGYSLRLGYPPEWQRHPITGEPASPGHWSEIDEFQQGDAKFWWEPSRFTWAFTLARAYLHSRDERYAESFWELTESWMNDNQPYFGINWKCGQEGAFRVMAACFALYAFRNSRFSTDTRLERFVRLIYIHGKRIDAYLEYARSQKNNHALSEGVGLWTIGLLFPELADAGQWRARGRQIIQEQVHCQIYLDGSYIQHSSNYHRVMLHDLLWAIRLGECNHDRLSASVYRLFHKAVRFLYAITDPDSGIAPNYGANDGALVLPLSDCAYPDMRPVLQACHFHAEKTRLYPAGPWDEEMMWINGAESLQAPRDSAPVVLQPFSAESGGYFILRSQSSWALLRAAKYRDRPSHADQLHLDLWWRGENVLCDSGTYSYNAQTPFDHAFASTRFHNTVVVDELDQMTRLTRFLWGDWANATIHTTVPAAGPYHSIEAVHDGYARRGVVHRRAVSHTEDDCWIVVDDLIADGMHTARLHWLISDVPIREVNPDWLELQFKAGVVRMRVAAHHLGSFELVRAGERVAGSVSEPPEPSDGWQSRYYGKMAPALSLSFSCRSLHTIRFVTIIELGKQQPLAIDLNSNTIQSDSRTIQLSSPGVSPIFSSQS